ncbi:hypothetical protein OG21DRAFT_300906 [Imleria badia]|nr:hypothetical protein OG21DRAFT_300906 [Imleria badia]
MHHPKYVTLPFPQYLKYIALTFSVNRPSAISLVWVCRQLGLHILHVRLIPAGSIICYFLYLAESRLPGRRITMAFNLPCLRAGCLTGPTPASGDITSTRSLRFSASLSTSGTHKYNNPSVIVRSLIPIQDNNTRSDGSNQNNPIPKYLPGNNAGHERFKDVR